MAKTAAVLGATGAQGGGVARALLKAGWNVTAITRNVSSDSAKALATAGASLVTANLDDEQSLISAFKGAHAIFGVTNFWEHLYTGSDLQTSGEKERQQAINIAQAASKTNGLEHYIFSSLPSAKKISGGKLSVPHLDYKAEVDDYIRQSLPDLAKKTTFIWLGWYPTNLAFFPMLKALELPTSGGKYVFIAPTPPDAFIPVSGDVPNNTGKFVQAILENPSKSQGKYVKVATEIITFREVYKVWSEVTGKPSSLVSISGEQFEDFWGTPGKELAAQYTFGAEYSDWGVGGEVFLTAEELGLQKGDLIGLKQVLVGLKSLLT
ncbi:hypothetical protein DL95DRAFT_478045 [Leptodontidium sp. 2 PMI_412]|nr:hypothetical protein DL95DRAFT_478045 [Leptodontidium sp. 2 PMI_412]